MGFDQNEDKPLMDPKKPDTKTNIWMVVGIVVFLLFGFWAVIQVWQDPPESSEEIKPVDVVP